MLERTQTLHARARGFGDLIHRSSVKARGSVCRSASPCVASAHTSLAWRKYGVIEYILTKMAPLQGTRLHWLSAESLSEPPNRIPHRPLSTASANAYRMEYPHPPGPRWKRHIALARTPPLERSSINRTKCLHGPRGHCRDIAMTSTSGECWI